MAEGKEPWYSKFIGPAAVALVGAIVYFMNAVTDNKSFIDKMEAEQRIKETEAIQKFRYDHLRGGTIESFVEILYLKTTARRVSLGYTYPKGQDRYYTVLYNFPNHGKDDISGRFNHKLISKEKTAFLNVVDDYKYLVIPNWQEDDGLISEEVKRTYFDPYKIQSFSTQLVGKSNGLLWGGIPPGKEVSFYLTVWIDSTTYDEIGPVQFADLASDYANKIRDHLLLE